MCVEHRSGRRQSRRNSTWYRPGKEARRLACFPGSEESINGPEQRFLIALGQLVDSLETAEETSVDGRRLDGLLEPKELVCGDLQSSCEPGEHVGMGT